MMKLTLLKVAEAAFQRTGFQVANDCVNHIYSHNGLSNVVLQAKPIT